MSVNQTERELVKQMEPTKVKKYVSQSNRARIGKTDENTPRKKNGAASASSSPFSSGGTGAISIVLVASFGNGPTRLVAVAAAVVDQWSMVVGWIENYLGENLVVTMIIFRRCF